MAITLSNKNFYANPNAKLTLSLNTLIHDELEKELSKIQCGVSQDPENQARVSKRFCSTELVFIRKSAMISASISLKDLET